LIDQVWNSVKIAITLAKRTYYKNSIVQNIVKANYK